MTMVKVHECCDEERPLLEVLRDLDASAILLDDDPRLDELHAIRETALNNDFALVELIKLKPHLRAVYERQWQQAEDELDRRVAKLGIKSL